MPGPVAASPAPAAKPEEKMLFHLQPSWVTPVIVYGLGSVILFGATLVALLTLTGVHALVILLGLALVLGVLVVMLALLVFNTIRRQMTHYTFTDRRLYVQQGVVKRTSRSIPLPTIQRVTLKQGVLQKLFGIGNLTVHAAVAGGKEELTLLFDIAHAAQALKRIEDLRSGRL